VREREDQVEVDGAETDDHQATEAKRANSTASGLRSNRPRSRSEMGRSRVMGSTDSFDSEQAPVLNWNRAQGKSS